MNDVSVEREVPVCGVTRRRKLGYQLRCLLPRDHAGSHRWTPELVGAAKQSVGERASGAADRVLEL
jgi:hypothetical protein